MPSMIGKCIYTLPVWCKQRPKNEIGIYANECRSYFVYEHRYRLYGLWNSSRSSAQVTDATKTETPLIVPLLSGVFVSSKS